MQMNLVDLVVALKKEIYRQISIYEGYFSSEIPDSKKDQYSNAIRFYQSLSDENKGLFLHFVEQVICDTTANIFSWLDGVYFLENQSKDLELKYEGEESPINGYLKDIWLEIAQGGDVNEMRVLYKDF